MGPTKLFVNSTLLAIAAGFLLLAPGVADAQQRLSAKKSAGQTRLAEPGSGASRITLRKSKKIVVRRPAALVVRLEPARLSFGQLAGLHGSAEPSDLAMMADGEVIAASTARRLCCDAGVVVANLDAQGGPLSVGPKLGLFQP